MQCQRRYIFDDRKLPRQADSCKIEFPAFFKMYPQAQRAVSAPCRVDVERSPGIWRIEIRNWGTLYRMLLTNHGLREENRLIDRLF